MTWNTPSSDRLREAVQQGDRSRAAARFTEAIDAYTRAMVVRGDDLLPDEEARFRVRIAECFLETGDLDSAELALAPVDRLDENRITPEPRGAFLTIHGRIALYRGRHEDAVMLATEAWELLRGTGANALVARALTVRAHGQRQLGQLEPAREDYADALSAARRAGDEHEIGLAAANMGNLLWLSGRYTEAREHHLRAVEIHEACGSETHLGRELFALAVDEFHVGNWSGVDALLTRCDERAERIGDRRFSSSVAISRARLEHARGQDPRSTLEHAKLIAGDGGYDHDLIVIAQVLADAAMERGDWSEARRQLRDATDRARRTAPEGEPFVDSQWRLARCMEAMGDRDGQVVSMLERTLETAARKGYRVAEACTRRTLGRCLLNRGHVDEARAQLEAALATFRELRMKWETGRSLLALAQLVAETAEG
ncbi:tetratricopeptide repeat protein, partial [bacterium]|nr:tetratricopeptide repeat protein [bacterium]